MTNRGKQGDRQCMEVELFQNFLDPIAPFAALTDSMEGVACGPLW